MIRAGIFGATGYAGYELLRVLTRHPEVEITFASSTTYAGMCYRDVYPCALEQVLVSPDEVSLDGVDVVFLCTPHGTSAPYARRALEAGARCVDLSADFRLHDIKVYENWYGTHLAPGLLPEAVYGLTEIYRQQVAGARLVANPGCYPTGPLLALYPLATKGIITGGKVIIRTGIASLQRGESLGGRFRAASAAHISRNPVHHLCLCGSVVEPGETPIPVARGVWGGALHPDT